MKHEDKKVSTIDKIVCWGLSALVISVVISVFVIAFFLRSYRWGACQ